MDAVVVEMQLERAALASESVRVERKFGPNRRGGTTYWTPVFPQGTWAFSALPVSLQIGLPKSRDLGDFEDAEVEVAARAWGRVSCTAFRAHVTGTTSTGPGDDGVSGVYFEDTAWPSMFDAAAIATTVVHVDAQGHIYDADVYVNGATHVFSRDGRPGTIDFRSIATHEIGHVLGLGESADARATMYASYAPGVAWRSLESDDEDGVCTLYPGTGDLLGCEQTACPSGFVCVARQCEELGDPRMLCSPCNANDLAGCEGSGDTARCVAYDAGYACGRSCATNDDCGAGFACVATTQAGDFQCVASDGCSSAANPCQNIAECNDPFDGGWTCTSACMGSLPKSQDAGTDASPDGGVIPTPTGGCSCNQSPSASDGFWSLSWLAMLLARSCRASSSRAPRRSCRTSP
ncbi:MAG TPA: matrixin family metalloprotease [Polyangiaceae bacterium]